jgi:hypothetical protein
VLKNLDFLFAFPELTASNDQAAVRTLSFLDLRLCEHGVVLTFIPCCHQQLDKMRTYEILNPGFMLVHPNASTFQQFVEFSHRLNTEDSVMSTAEQGTHSPLPSRTLASFIRNLPHSLSIDPQAC